MHTKPVSPVFQCRRHGGGVVRWLFKVNYDSNVEFFINAAVWFAIIVLLSTIVGTAHAGQELDQATTTVTTLPDGSSHTTYTYSQSADSVVTAPEGGKPTPKMVEELNAAAKALKVAEKPVVCTVTFTGSRVIPLIGWRRSVTQDIVVNADPKRWNLQNTDDYVFVQLTSEVTRQAIPLPTWCAETVSVACPLLGGGEVTEMVDVKQ